MTNATSAESLFKTLKAENEPWLGEVFVSLPVFERLKEEHSSILYGETGSGKTAMRIALTKQVGEKAFTVLWTPEPVLDESAAGTALARQSVKQALRACMEALILEGKLPQRLGEPSAHIASALQWFLRNYLPFDAEFYLQSQTDRLPQDELQWYKKLLNHQVHPITNDQTGLKDQIQLLLLILRAAKYERLWLMIDGLERWTTRQTGGQVEALLEAALSTLVIFDLSGVDFKFFVPASLKSALHKTGGVERHRASEADLTWSAEELQVLLEKRLAYALSLKKASLDSLCDGSEFLNWLKEYGGASPRAWLQFTAPLLSEYQQSGKRMTAVQTRDFLRHHPAPLRLQRERREVWLGEKRIPIGSAPEFRILEYLAARPGKIGSLEELYYYAYKELETVPDKGEPAWTAKDIWRAAMDTLLWRVRKKIEPDPREPLYLLTHHGKGVELLHAEV
ncbi:MAG: hypothetical protein OHK003_20070 [Anaerolineales bacterium]